MKEKILNPFLYDSKLKFNQIQKSLNLRSNKLAYYLNKLLEEGIIEKNQEEYTLSKEYEHLIPYISTKQSPLSVLLILIKKEDKVFLIKRNKRPFKNRLGLPGGRLLLNETIKEGTKRIMKEKFNVNVDFKQINSISLEHIKKDETTIHSFILFLITAETNEKIELKNLKELRKDIIPSDYWLIKNNSNKNINLDYLVSKE